jgi:enediyne biosynthesis protein E4
MGVGVGDYDLDGHLDLFKTHFLDDANILYLNDGKGNFDDATRAARIGVETRYICWGAGIVDLDNDGLPDLFMVTGHVYPEVERTLPQYPNKTPRAVFRNLGGGTLKNSSSRRAREWRRPTVAGDALLETSTTTGM